MDISDLIAAIRQDPDCAVKPAAGGPHISHADRLPSDVVVFYRLCGGMTLFEHADYPIEVVAEDQVVPANPVIVGEEVQDDRSASWYIIADCGNGDYVTIDCSPARAGRCYDSFHETYGLVGDMPIIAETFTGFLERCFANRGRRFYWLLDSFVPPGDAYD